jgi:hypothetical protein
MRETKGYESFPIRIVILCNLVAIPIYAIGAYILAGFGAWLSILYLLYCFWMEIRLLKGSCVDCYYYGQVCGFGKGKLCSLLFKKGDPQKFAEKKVSWLQMLPDLMVFILPLVGGIVLLVRDFAWLLLLMLAILVMLSSGGNAVARGSFACKFCKQREIGCPAEKLFEQRETRGQSGRGI